MSFSANLGDYTDNITGVTTTNTEILLTRVTIDSASNQLEVVFSLRVSGKEPFKRDVNFVFSLSDPILVNSDFTMDQVYQNVFGLIINRLTNG